MQPRLIKTIVVDDEKPSREALVTYLRDFCPQVEIVSECDSVKSAFQSIQKYKPHLVFLDIEMPNGNGFDLLQLFKNPTFKVVFVTAFSDYAIRAFRFSAIDYLLKPVKVDELIEAVEKVGNELKDGFGNLNLQNLVSGFSENHHNHHKLVIPGSKVFSIVLVDDIIMCQAEGYLTHFFLSGKRKIHATKSLKYYEELFENRLLIRVHRSFLINLSHVKGYTNQNEILLEEGHSCPLSESFKQQFISRLSAFS